MYSELKRVVEACLWERAGVLTVADHLPKDDALLDRLFAEIIQTSDPLVFEFATVAALAQKRPFPAHHLTRGISMLSKEVLVGSVILHSQPDERMPELLVEAAAQAIPHKGKAVCLSLAANWCMKHREGQIPPKLLTEARLLGRALVQTKIDEDTESTVLSHLTRILSLTADRDLRSVLAAAAPENAEDDTWMAEQMDRWFRDQLHLWKSPVLNHVPERQIAWGGGGSDIKRAAPKLGRNELCHCGSSLKYKRCCIHTDEARVRLSSHVPGVTIGEIHACPEPYATGASISAASNAELARYRVEMLPGHVVPTFLTTLCARGLLDKMMECLEKTGWLEELGISWTIAQIKLVEQWRPDLAHRLTSLRDNGALTSGFKLLLSATEPTRFISHLQQEPLSLLDKANTDSECFYFAVSLLYSPCPALGILVARGIIPMMEKGLADRLLNEVLMARDRLQLAADDPVRNLLGSHQGEAGETDIDKTRAELFAVRQRLLDKTAESRKLRASLDRLQADNQRKSQLAAEASARATPDQSRETIEDLRTKVNVMKSMLKELHQERSSMREELLKTKQDLSRAHLSSSTQRIDYQEEVEDELDDAFTEPADFDNEIQPVRLLEFPRRFHDTLDRFPSPVARHAMQQLGRLAAGESAAFRGLVKLRGTSGHYRVRIGREHRLIFTLDAETLVVTDLINRRDLERRLKSLNASPTARLVKAAA